MAIQDLTAVFVVGGKGVRLGLNDVPKPMVSVAGVPLLERAVQQVARQGVRRVIMLAGYLGERIQDYFGDGSRWGISIEVVIEERPLGPAGCFQLIRERLKGPFLVIYGDILWDVDLSRFASFAVDRGGLGTLYVHPNDHPFDSDLVEIDSQFRVLAFHPKPHASAQGRRNLVSAAFYLLWPEILDHIPPAPESSDWGKDILPEAVKSGGAIYAYRGTEYLRDIGTPDRLAESTADLLSGVVGKRSYRVKQRAVFLDRDGVLNREIGGVRCTDELEVLPGVPAAIRRLNRAGILTVCVTNQPGRAKGWLTAVALEAVHARLDAELARGKAYLDDLFVCPHHPEAGWPGEDPALKIVCSCRKPEPGMLLSAAAAHNIDLPTSFMIGDTVRDLEAGRRAGVRTILVGSDAEAIQKLDHFPDARRAADLSQAVELLLGLP